VHAELAPGKAISKGNSEQLGHAFIERRNASLPWLRQLDNGRTICLSCDRQIKHNQRAREIPSCARLYLDLVKPRPAQEHLCSRGWSTIG